MADHLICECRKRLPSGFTLEAALRVPLEESPVTVLFGPSGSGKSTLLRLIAGLERPDEGRIQFRGEVWFDSSRRVAVAPQLRRAGFLSQDYSLFPHLTVRENVGFAARDPKRAAHLLERFGLSGLEGRRPRAISGGQQQRVALARALAADPGLLLLDEPLSALDATMRARLRHDLRRLLADSGVPSLLVTHDRVEALALGDWMAVLIQGRIHQTGRVEEVFRRPADVEVAHSVGVENVIAGEIAGRESGLLTVRAGGGLLQCVDTGETGPVFACIRAEDVTLAPGSGAPSTARNRWCGAIRSLLPEGAVTRVEIDCGFPLMALVTAQSVEDLRLRPGAPVCAMVKATSVHLLPR